MPTVPFLRTARRAFLSAALLGLPVALAQVGAPSAALTQDPALSGFTVSGGHLSSAAGVRLDLTPRGRFVSAATLTLPTRDPAQAAKYLNLLLGDDYSREIGGFLSSPAVQAALPGGLKVQVDTHDLAAKVAGAGLQFTVTLHQQQGFGPVPVARTLGSAAASIVVRLYSDFQCPYCQQAEQQALPAVLAQLAPDTRFEFHHFPLERLHANARSAAEASVCAEQQGRFFPFKDALFRRNDWQQAADPTPSYAAVAAQLKLNMAAFNACNATHAGRAEVDAGLAEARGLGLSGTPSVFVNGYQVADPYDPASYLQLIEYVRAGPSAGQGGAGQGH